VLGNGGFSTAREVEVAVDHGLDASRIFGTAPAVGFSDDVER
jgi:hypothetical protein